MSRTDSTDAEHDPVPEPPPLPARRPRRRAVGPAGASPGASPVAEPDLDVREPWAAPRPDDDERLRREVPPHHGS